MSKKTEKEVELMRALSARKVKLPEGATPKYHLNDPDESGERGSGWYYPIHTGEGEEWVFLGREFETALANATASRIRSGIVGERAASKKPSTMATALEWGTPILLGAAQGTADGTLRDQGHDAAANTVNAALALGGLLLARRSGNNVLREAGRTAMAVSTALTAKEYVAPIVSQALDDRRSKRLEAEIEKDWDHYKGLMGSGDEAKEREQGQEQEQHVEQRQPVPVQ